jgi:hypothetical protein
MPLRHTVDMTQLTASVAPPDRRLIDACRRCAALERARDFNALINARVECIGLATLCFGDALNDAAASTSSHESVHTQNGAATSNGQSPHADGVVPMTSAAWMHAQLEYDLAHAYLENGMPMQVRLIGQY